MVGTISDQLTFWLEDVRVFIHDDSGWRGKLLDPDRSADEKFGVPYAWFPLKREVDERARALGLRLKETVLPALDERDPRREALIGIGKSLSELRFATRSTRDDTRVLSDRKRGRGRVLKATWEHVPELTSAVERCRAVYRDAEHLFDATENEFRRDGVKWVFKYGGESARVKHCKGFAYIKELIEYPEKHIDAAVLIQSDGGMAATSEDDQIGEAATSGAAIREDGLSVTVGGASSERDPKAIETWENALVLLQDEVDDAKASGDAESADIAQCRLDQFKKVRSQRFNYKGRERDSADPQERARNAVGGAIGRAKKILEGEIPALGKHIRKSVKSSGGSFIYSPEQPVDWDL